MATVSAAAEPLPGAGLPVPSRSRKSPRRRSRYSSGCMAGSLEPFAASLDAYGSRQRE